MSLKVTVLFLTAMALGLIWSACRGAGTPAETPVDLASPSPTISALDAGGATPTQATSDTRTIAATPTPIKLVSEIVAPFSGTGYLILAPSVLSPGRSEEISVSLFSGREPESGNIRLSLVKGGTAVS